MKANGKTMKDKHRRAIADIQLTARPSADIDAKIDAATR